MPDQIIIKNFISYFLGYFNLHFCFIYLFIYLRYFSINRLLLCLLYDPTLVKLEALEGHVAFGLSVCVCVTLCVGVGVCWLGCMQRCGWLAGSVGHFFETLNGEC